MLSASVRMKLKTVINSMINNESVSLIKSVEPKFISSKYSSFGLEYSDNYKSLGAISLIEKS